MNRKTRGVLSCLLVGALGCTRSPPDAPEKAVNLPSPPADASAESDAEAAEGAGAEDAAAPDAGEIDAEARTAAPPVFTGPQELSALDAVGKGAVERGDVTGAVIAVVRGGKVIFQRAYGLRRKEPNAEPMTTGTVFDLASLTKVLATAPSIAVLA